jgi:glycosyltransferase involved in cell wall biosynthesis
MKINLIIFISEFNRGGAGNSLFRLCKYLPKNLYNINVICLNKCAYKNELKENFINVYEIFSKKTSLAMFEVKNITKKIISKKYKKNIFISNIYYSNILSIIFLRTLEMKIILIERTPFEELSIYFGIINLIKKKIMKFLIGFTYKYADVCISNSKYISNQYNKVYNLNFKTIYPPSFIKINNFKKKTLPKKKLYLGTVCRLSEEKGLKDFLNIIPKMKFDLKFFIIGDGPDKQCLKKITSKLGIQKKIVFLGFLNTKQVYKQLKKVDLFINCSYFEGFPNSVVEALGAGVPVMASQSYGGINEIIKNKNFGYIYKNQEDLIKNITSYSLGLKKFNFTKKTISKHLKKFSVEHNIKKYSDVFKEI